MKTIDTHGTFEEAIAQAPESVQQIARELRELILDVYPDSVEVPWPNQQISGYGVGPKKMSEHFCYVATFPERANLGFFYGADLSDPAGLLEGTGKKLRHVKIRSEDEIRQPALRTLVAAAVSERREALGV